MKIQMMQMQQRNGDGMDEFLVGGGGAVLAPSSSAASRAGAGCGPL
jgi:hypothetical protein